MNTKIKIGIVMLVTALLATVTVSAVLTINQLTQDTGIFFAPDYASSGSGTTSNPYIDCLYNSYNLMTTNFKGEIYFPKGQYVETHPSVFDFTNTKPQHVAITGAGFWDSVIRCSSNIGGPLITVINHASVYIQGVTLRGHMSVAQPVVYLRDSYDVIIQNTFICRGHGDGIQLGSADGTKYPWATDIINCPIEYFDGNGIVIYGCHNTYMESLTLGSNHGYNILMGGNANNDLTITGSCIAGNEADGIRIGKYTSATITDNSFEVTGKGIVFEGNDYRPVIISNNKFVEGTYGIYFKSGIQYNVQITGNDFSQDTYACNLPMTLKGGRVTDNIKLNPFGKYSTPFYVSDGVYSITLCNGQVTPVKNAMYTIQITDCRIVSTEGTGVTISVYDGKGSLIKSCVSICDEQLAVGQVVSFNYSTAPTVSVYFK